MDIEFHHAGEVETQGTGWFVGFSEWTRNHEPGSIDLRFLPQDVRSHGFCIKWMAHATGDPRGTSKPPSQGRTLSILVSEQGRFRLQFSRQADFREGEMVEYVLDRHGQFVIWGENLYHRWLVDAACTILTVRWIPEVVPAP